MSATYYKVLGGPDGLQSCHGGTLTWVPGEWMPAILDVAACERGYHVCTAAQLLDWLSAETAVWTAEIRGARVDADDKTVAAEARIVTRLAWTPQTSALFAADCAERVLPLYERAYPTDRRPRAAIQYLHGEATA